MMCRGGTSGLPGGLEGSRWLVFASKSVTGFGGDIDGAARELVDGDRRGIRSRRRRLLLIG